MQPVHKSTPSDDLHIGLPCASIKDKYGRYLYLNPTLERLFRIAPGEMIGKTDYHLFPDDTASVLRDNDRRVLIRGEELTTLEIAHLPGSVLDYWMVNKFPAPCQNGVLLGVLGVIVSDVYRAFGRDKAEEIGRRRLASHAQVKVEILELARTAVEAPDTQEQRSLLTS